MPRRSIVTVKSPRVRAGFNGVAVGKIVFSVLASCLVACGGGANPDRDAAGDFDIQGLRFLALDGGGLTASGGGVQGTGSVLSLQALPGVSGANGFNIAFTLQDGGRLVMVTNADRKLKGGVEIDFSRTGTSLTVLVRAQGTGIEVDWSEHFAEIDASGEISLFIDVHNDHGDYAHLLFWTGSAEEPFLDSGEHTDGAPGNGVGGEAWGFHLTDAELRAAARNDPRDSH